MKILAFDTSNKPLSVAVVVDGEVLAHVESTEKKTHSISILPDIKNTLEESNLTINDIDLIAVSKGPGSYTGVRIAVTVAKTLVDTLSKKLVGVSSLELLAANGDKAHILIPLMSHHNCFQMTILMYLFSKLFPHNVATISNASWWFL